MKLNDLLQQAPGGALRAATPQVYGWFAFTALLLLFLAAAGGFYAGNRFEQDRADQAIAQYERDAAQQRADAETAARKLLEAETLRGNDLARELALKQEETLKTQGELDAALEKVTTGRACLNAGTLRVLDRAPGLRRRVSTTARKSDATAARHAAADSAQSEPESLNGTEMAESSDTDIVHWAVAAGSHYRDCIDARNALIQFERGRAESRP